MAAIEREAESSASNPILHTFTPRAGILQDVFALEFQIWDTSTATPAQTFPGSGRHTVDLGDDRIGLGHYAAAWTVPVDEPLGRHEIRWFATLAEGDNEVRWRVPFDVLALVVDGQPGYALVSDVRAEGAPFLMTDERIQIQIALASELFEKWTGRFFEPRYQGLRVDGANRHVLPLGQPIIALQEVQNERSGSVIEASSYRVYNRHLTEGLKNPDDRDNPRIELINGCAAEPEFANAIVTSGSTSLHAPANWRGKHAPQNTLVRGLFGYTEPDGSPTGRTPHGIRRACALYALKLTSPGGTTVTAPGGGVTGAVVEKRTREQTIKYGDVDKSPAGNIAAPFTGNVEIDRLIGSYVQTVSGTAI